MRTVQGTLVGMLMMAGFWGGIFANDLAHARDDDNPDGNGGSTSYGTTVTAPPWQPSWKNLPPSDNRNNSHGENTTSSGSMGGGGSPTESGADPLRAPACKECFKKRAAVLAEVEEKKEICKETAAVDVADMFCREGQFNGKPSVGRLQKFDCVTVEMATMCASSPCRPKMKTVCTENKTYKSCTHSWFGDRQASTTSSSQYHVEGRIGGFSVSYDSGTGTVSTEGYRGLYGQCDDIAWPQSERTNFMSEHTDCIYDASRKDRRTCR